MFTRLLKKGSKGDDVKALQQRLNIKVNAGLTVDGNFGQLTENALKKYQSKNNIAFEGDGGYGQLGPRTRASLNGIVGLYPKIAKMRDQLVSIMELLGSPIIVTDEYRTSEEQNALYEQGRTKKGKIVTNARAGESLHNWRCAFDIAFRNGNRITYKGNWNTVGKVGEILGLEWGGRWTSFEDRPHFQYTAGYSLNDFQTGSIDINRFKE